MKKICCFFALIALLTAVIPSFAEEISLFLNGNKITCDPAPVIENGRTLIPARALFEEMGAAVSWDGENQRVGIDYGNIKISMTIGDRTAVVSDKAVGLDVPPAIINGRTMIPLRFVSESIGADVSWDGEKRAVSVTMADENGSEKEDDPAPLKTVIKEVTFSKREDHDVLSFTASGNYTVSKMTLTDPDREVFDLKGAALSGKGMSFEGDFSRVRVGSHDGYVRVVLEGDEPLRYIYADNGGVINVKIYSEKKNFDFLGETDKTFIFPEGASLSASSDGQSVTISVSGVTIGDESMRINDSLVTSAQASSNIVTVALKSTASVKTDNNKVILTPGKTEDNKNNNTVNKNLVVLDAGHGGSDPGSLGKDESGENVLANEKDMNLKITLMVADMLKENGVEVALTRSDDVYVGLAERAEFANAKNAALFVSIHNNSIPQPEYKGSMVLYYATSTAGKALARNILDEMTKSAGTIDRGLRDGTNMAVIRRTDMPAVIVECGCLTNQEELANLMDDEFLRKLAEGITAGIIKTMKTL